MKARLHEAGLYLANRPLQFASLKLTRLLDRVVYLPGVGYVVNDALIAKKVLEDTEHFSSGGRGGLGDMTTKMVGHLHALINTQGAEHDDLKKQLYQLFSDDYLTMMIQDALEDSAAGLTVELRTGKPVDLADYIKRCTSLMTAHMIGLPLEARRDAKLLRHVADTVNRLTRYLAIGKIDLSAAEQADIKCIYDELSDLVRDGYDHADQRPKAVVARLRAMGMDFDQAKSILTVMLVAGTETVSSALPRITALLIDSGQWNKLCADRSLLPGAINEGLRYVSPAPVILHASIADTTIGGYRFKADRRVIIALHNILHDSRYTPRPNSFDMTRQQNPDIKNLWFGAGPHMCLGFFLARKELAVNLTALLDAGDVEVIKRRAAHNVSFPGYDELWLKRR